MKRRWATWVWPTDPQERVLCSLLIVCDLVMVSMLVWLFIVL